MQLEVHHHPYVKELLTRYNVAMDSNLGFFDRAFKDIAISDYENVLQTQSIEPENIAKNLGKVVHSTEKFLDYIKRTRRYNRTYSLQATWASSCTHDPEVCAVVLVGIAPMLYAGLRCLIDAAADAFMEGPASIQEHSLISVLETLGYEGQPKRGKVRSSDIRSALSDVNKDVLNVLYDLAGFWAFY